MEEKRVAEYRSPDGTFTYDISQGAGFYVLNQAGEESLADAKHLAAALQDLHRRVGNRYALLMPLPEDFKGAKPEARKVMSDTVLTENSPLSKFAIYGGSFLLRSMFNLYTRVSKVPVRLFATREEAEAWLKN